MNAIFIIAVIFMCKLCLCIPNPIQTKVFNRFNVSSEDLLANCVLTTIGNNFRSKPTIIMNNNLSEGKTTLQEFDIEFTNKLIANEFPRIVSGDIFNTTSLYMQENVLTITYVDSCKKLSSIQINTNEDEMKYLVIVFDYAKEHCDQILQVIGRNTSMYDVTFIMEMSENNYSILTFIPEINVTTCSMQYDLPPTILSSCDSKKNFNAFPSKKLKNYLGCPFKVGMGSLFPFADITNKSGMNTYDKLNETEIYGSDIEMLKIIGTKFNFSLDLYFILRAEENPFVETSFLNFLLNGSLDLCAGGLYRTYGDIVEYSGVYGRQAVIWMYAAKRDTRSWQGLVEKIDGLYIFMTFYFVYSMIWKIFCIFDKRPISIGRMLLNTWGALIGTSSLDKGLTLKEKILNLVYLIMCMHLSAYVSIQMFSFLTILSPPTIYKTNTDVIQSGLRPYLMMKMKYFMNDNSYEAFANTSADCESFEDCEEKSLIYNGVTVVIDGQFIALQAQTAVNDEAITLRVNENLLTIYHEMLLRKDVPIVKDFQRMMVRLRESGISDRLYDEAIGILTKAKSESANKNILSHSYSCVTGCSITLDQSAGAFYVWILGCIVSVFTFFIEILVKREKNIYQVTTLKDSISERNIV